MNNSSINNDLDFVKHIRGLRIFNYEASSIYSKNRGTRESYDKKEVIFANCLLSDFLFENGLKTFNYKYKDDKWSEQSEKVGKYTRDIICVKFTSNVKSFKDEYKALNKKQQMKEKELVNIKGNLNN